jgi:hypothetical protein
MMILSTNRRTFCKSHIWCFLHEMSMPISAAREPLVAPERRKGKKTVADVSEQTAEDLSDGEPVKVIRTQRSRKRPTRLED